jgi:DNA (cytosine-5)-methyltransferase 1
VSDLTCFSLFSGCGGSDSGMVAAGYRSIGGIEYHAPAADIYDLNHATPVTRANILDIDRIPTVDLLWISPPCPAFSIANPNRGETPKDIALARHIIKLAIESRPRSIAIENVRGYINSQSLSLIQAALDRSGYRVDDLVYNAANYGTPSTRMRLIVRSSLDRLSEVKQTHCSPRRSNNTQMSMFDRLPNWVSWYEAIANRIEDLPRSELTANQKMAISSNTATTLKDPNRILIERVGYYNGEPNTYRSDIPAPTIRAHQHIDDRGTYRVSHNIIDNGDVYAADIQCLATWQSFPVDYQWGSHRGESGRAIGNAVPPKLAEAIARSFGKK